MLSTSGDVAYQSPLTPADLLIALHNLDDKVDMKTTIKGEHSDNLKLLIEPT